MNISAKSADFTCSSSREEVKNVSANQRLGQPSWISNGFKMIQFFRSPRGTILVSLMAFIGSEDVELFYDIQTDRQRPDTFR